MNNIISDPQYTNVIADLKVQLKGLMQKYENNKSLADFRTITNKNFGAIVEKNKGEPSVEDIITNK